MSEKVIGIMGGMGPEAGADLFLRITAATHAKTDTDHLHIILDSNPKMPSRQDAILNGGESPVPAMIATAENLIKAGADVIIIGANTAHYFYDDVAAAVSVPFLHIIDEAVRETVRQAPLGFFGRCGRRCGGALYGESSLGVFDSCHGNDFVGIDQRNRK